MNIYKKLQTCRVELQKMNLKKSGENKFAKYFYYELGDFLPHIQDLFLEHGLCGVASFTADLATLTIYDDTSDASVVFTSPMGSAALKGCHDVQNVGAVETYQRRYLYQAALEIVESDAVDATTTKETPTVAKKPYSDADFDKNLSAWAEKIADGSTTGAKIIDMISTKYVLSDEQKEVLKNV